MAAIMVELLHGRETTVLDMRIEWIGRMVQEQFSNPLVNIRKTRKMRLSDDKIDMMFHLMEYDYLTDKQHDLIVNLEQQWLKTGYLSEKQEDTLEDIFTKAAESVEWSR